MTVTKKNSLLREGKMEKLHYGNIEIHNAAALCKGAHGGATFLRYPEAVCAAFEKDGAATQAGNCSGAELRFLMKSDRVVLQVRSESVGHYHIFRGGLQGGWYDHEGRTTSPQKTEIVIEKKEQPLVERMHRDLSLPWDPSLIRIILDRGRFEILGVSEGEIELPCIGSAPKKTILFYGSSITHGSNALNASDSWTSRVAHGLGMDYLNKGLAGSCYMEDSTVSYLASLGQSGAWDVAVLELGINALAFDAKKRLDRVENTLEKIAGGNPDKPVFVISPFYSDEDYRGGTAAEAWRETIRTASQTKGYKNLTYIPGNEILSDMSGISTDGVHPSVYGIAQIHERLLARIRPVLDAKM